MKILLIIIAIMGFQFTDKDLITVRDEPHKLGWMLGFNKLTPMHSKWIIDVWDKKIPLQAHRGSYKTTAIAIVGPIRELIRFPNSRIGLYKKPYGEAAKTLYTIRQCFDIPELLALFDYAHGFKPQLIKKKENMLTFNFKKTLTNEGSLNAYGIEHVRTGTHLDEALCDDIMTLDDRTSKAKRERTKDGIREVQTNIVDNDRPVMFDGTPWHKDDGWTLIGKPKKYPVKKTGLLTKKEVESKKRKTTTSLYAANYDLEHLSDKDKEFGDPIYGKWDFTVKNVVAHLDAKYSGDHTNGLTFMARKPDGKIQAIGFTWPEHVDEKLDEIVRLYKKFRAGIMYNEKNADKGYLAKALRAKGVRIPERANYSEAMNKHIKISKFLKQFWYEIIWHEDTDAEYMNQIIDYKEGEEPDDCPDSAASLLVRAFLKGAGSNALNEW